MLRVFEDGRRNPHGFSSAHYGQLCKALLDLQDAADKIFDTVTDRVGAEHQRLRGLSSRIQTAKAKINAISGTNRAITIKSSSRYPSASSDVEDFRPLFGGKFGGVRTDCPVASLSLNGGLSRESGEDGTLELFRFFSETSHEYFSNNKNRKVGLGNMPSDTNSVQDILLFNSTELPYHRYTMMDNLIVGEPSIEESLELKHAPLPPPPPSLLQGSRSSSTRSEDFGFRPTLRQVPSFSLPSSLPDLPMVADISWTGLVQGLDDYSLTSSVSERDNTSQKRFSFNEGVPSKLSNQTFTSDNSVHALVQNASSKEIPSLSPPPCLPRPRPQPPPPPPPPPPPISTPPLTLSLSSPISIEKQKHTGEINSPPTSAGDMSRSLSLLQIDSQRASLMASIRNPGIALKKTGFQESNSRANDSFINLIKTGDNLKQPEKMDTYPKPKSINLLAEMAATLKMRRLSMTGAAHDKDQIIASDVTSPSPSSTKFTLPINNLQTYIERRNEEMSEEEDWED